ncbi:heme exporter protein CcmD [Teredinibacter purpureus]|jgi:heme exporter protein CcmD|uniref:heme exporter protein CcmD n=1 Tax=Teredinibacter purpureus TaxID=2731756 RepID=UPI0005F7C56C|nr:heme exporter protein CcmD [Teredinibacter purpureus]
MDVVFQFSSVQDFFSMNGHGPYVWASYLITFSGIALLALSCTAAKRKFIKTQRSILSRKTD